MFRLKTIPIYMEEKYDTPDKIKAALKTQQYHKMVMAVCFILVFATKHINEILPLYKSIWTFIMYSATVLAALILFYCVHYLGKTVYESQRLFGMYYLIHGYEGVYLSTFLCLMFCVFIADDSEGSWLISKLIFYPSSILSQLIFSLMVAN